MYFAPVTPFRLLPMLPKTVRAHLILSNQVLASAESREAYELRFGENKGDGETVILDNPVHERLRIPSLRYRIEAARVVRPDIIVSPDVIGNPHESTRLLNHHLKSALGRKPYKTLAVVQGYDSEAYEKHIRYLAQRGVTIIGIPQIRRFGSDFSRARFILRLQADGFFETYPDVAIHLLGNIGMFEDALELVSKVPQVVGIDSAKPVYLAHRNVMIDIRSTELARTVRRVSGFTELTPEDIDEDLLRHNITTLQEWLSDK